MRGRVVPGHVEGLVEELEVGDLVADGDAALLRVQLLAGLPPERGGKREGIDENLRREKGQG